MEIPYTYEVRRDTGLTSGKIGIWLFLASEVMLFGALFSTYVFMPKRRVLEYSLDSDQTGDQFLFNLFIAPVALTVNFVASLPAAVQALLAGRLHSRVPATLLIAVGAFVALSQMNRVLFEHLTPADRQIAMAHPEYGTITVDWIVHLLAGHQIHHLRQLAMVK